MLPRVLFDLGFIKIYTFGFMVAVGIIIGGYFSLRLARDKGIPLNLVIDTIFYGLIAGIMGARFVFVLLNLQEYLTEPRHIIHIQAGGMSLHGGLLGGMLVVYIKPGETKYPSGSYLIYWLREQPWLLLLEELVVTSLAFLQSCPGGYIIKV